MAGAPGSSSTPVTPSRAFAGRPPPAALTTDGCGVQVMNDVQVDPPSYACNHAPDGTAAFLQLYLSPRGSAELIHTSTAVPLEFSCSSLAASSCNTYSSCYILLVLSVLCSCSRMSFGSSGCSCKCPRQKPFLCTKKGPYFPTTDILGEHRSHENI